MAKSLKPLIAKIDQHLAESLRGYRSGLEASYGNHRVLGFIVSESFNRIDHDKRQEKLRRLLRSFLTEDELDVVGPIVTMNPREADVRGDAA